MPFPSPLLRALGMSYGWTLLTPSAAAGGLFLLVTLLNPVQGLAGLLGCLSALGCARWQRQDDSLLPVHGFNGLLTGLLLGGLSLAGATLAACSVMGGLLASLLTQLIGAATWPLLRVPVLSLPFVAAGWLMMLALHAQSAATVTAVPSLFGGTMDRFLTTLGSILMQPQPLAGLMFLLCITVVSRWLALMALLGYLVSALPALLPGFPGLSHSAAFNAMLTAMALGGLFVTPGPGSLLLAVSGSLLTVLLDAALSRLTGLAGLLPLSLPFVLTTALGLHAARQAGQPRVQPEHPRIPERSLESRNLEAARVGRSGTLPLMLPVNGDWDVYQGFDGEHTHQGPWRYAIDLIVTEGGLSFHQDGSRIDHYYAFGLPVLSPCHGQVVGLVAEIPDNEPGAMNLEQNWGNYLLIRLAGGACVLLAHLQQGSLGVAIGDWLKPGDPVGRCGNSGRSPQPHLHLSVVEYAHPAAPTLPFHLCGLNRLEGDRRAFRLNHVPQTGDRLENVWAGPVLPLPLLPGRQLRYGDGGGHQTELTVDATLDGRFRISGRGSAAALTDNTPTVLACYEREGGSDRFLDLWLLAAGFTPASERVTHWHDRPPIRLLPASLWRALAWICPGLVSLDSRYRREWEPVNRQWRQAGEHRLFGRARLETTAWISPELGLMRLEARMGQRGWHYHLIRAAQQGDTGIPAFSLEFDTRGDPTCP
ncbi:urea transporter [Fluviicoccus keumensis]|uniref:Urea transporter n=1 Tax=Fluviicoccus keumensis TaxID=1435465 RepID=A0A4Q7ZBN1_9GAMM|nr:urea transporter [Fluviicoccus keumensis]RZU47383.1 urea transporter [Fluviicoccus keumensis]